MVEDIVEDRAVFDEDGFLFEESHGDVLVDPNRAGVGAVDTGGDAEKSGFAAAVACYEGELIAFCCVKSDGAEEYFDATLFGKAHHGYVMHGADVNSGTPATQQKYVSPRRGGA